eukprot:1196042-Prorocentrum_minimum.AAC.6
MVVSPLDCLSCCSNSWNLRLRLQSFSLVLITLGEESFRCVHMCLTLVRSLTRSLAEEQGQDAKTGKLCPDSHTMRVLVQHNEGPLVQPFVRNAGQDISHWFDKETGDVKSHVDPITNIVRPHCPEGRFLHIAPNEPISDWDTSYGSPWWRDKSCQRWVCV